MKKLSLLLFGPALLSFALVGSDASAGDFLFNFDTGPPGPGVLFTGNAEWRPFGGVGDSGYLKVTDAVNSELSAIIFPDLEGGAVVAGFSITADLRVGGGTDLPADGFSFNFVRPADPVLIAPVGEGWAARPGGEADLPEEGTTTGLAIGFDEWFSGEGDVIGMSVRIDNELIHQVELPTLNGALDDVTSLQTGPRGPGGPGDISELGWARLEIDLSTDNLLRIAYKNTVVFEDVVTYAPSTGQLVFGGRTGGANSTHHIDNIAISTIPITTPPVAEADGPYTLWVGDPLILNASASMDPEGQIVSYMWDLNDNGSFETDAEGQPFFVVDYEDVQNLGLAVGGMYDIHLKVTDNTDLTDMDSSSLRIVPEPATLSLLVLGGLAMLRRRR